MRVCSVSPSASLRACRSRSLFSRSSCAVRRNRTLCGVAGRDNIQKARACLYMANAPARWPSKQEHTPMLHAHCLTGSSAVLIHCCHVACVLLCVLQLLWAPGCMAGKCGLMVSALPGLRRARSSGSGARASCRGKNSSSVRLGGDTSSVGAMGVASAAAPSVESVRFTATDSVS